MADVIRDVVIRIALQQVETKLKVPDIAPSTSAVQEHGKAVDVPSQSYQAWEKAILETDRAVEANTRKVEELSIAQRMGQKSSGDFATKLKEHYEQAARDAEQFQLQSSAQMLKVGDALSKTGQSAFTLARGVAFVATSSDEDFQRMIQTVAKVQGAFDLFRGTIDTVKNIRSAITAWQAATAAAASANNVLAVSNTGVAVTGTAATAAMAPLLPLLLPLAAAAAAVGLAFAWTRETPKEIGELNDGLSETERRARSADAAIREMAASLSAARQRASAGAEELSIAEKLAGVRGEQLSIEQRISAVGEVRQKQIRAALTDVSLFREFSEFRFALPGFDPTQGLLNLADDMLGKGPTASDAKSHQQFVDAIVLQEGALAVQQAQADAASRTLRIREDEQKAIEQQIESHRELLRIAEERVRQQQSQLRTAREAFGDLDAEKQRELVRIAQKAPDQRSLEELRQFAQFGGSQAQGELAAERTRRAEAGGFDLFADAAGLKRDVEDAKRQARELERDLAPEIADLEGAISANKQAQKKELELLRAIVGDLAERSIEIDRIRNEFEDFKQRQQGAA